MERPNSSKQAFALVCGASQGLGRAIAEQFALERKNLFLLARGEETLQALSRELKEKGAPAAYAIAADLNDFADAAEKVQHLIMEKGVVSILINNTGGPAPGPVLTADIAAFQEAFQRHLLASHALLQIVLPGMKAIGFGRIINIISTSVREPIENLGVSNTIRGAVAAWSKSVANELPPGITINNILPGYTETPRLELLKEKISGATGISKEEVVNNWKQSVPEKRLGRPEEIAQAVSFLVSPSASYIRGVSLAVDGGRMRSI